MDNVLGCRDTRRPWIDLEDHKTGDTFILAISGSERKLVFAEELVLLEDEPAGAQKVMRPKTIPIEHTYRDGAARPKLGEVEALVPGRVQCAIYALTRSFKAGSGAIG